MAGVEIRDFSTPEEVRRPEGATVEVVKVGEGEVGRFTFQPGWRWSTCIKPVVGSDSCQVEHVGYVVSGSLHIQHDDGSTGDIIPGTVYRIAPGAPRSPIAWWTNASSFCSSMVMSTSLSGQRLA
ncbi:MAG TPA: cupin domain-containing protein [Acidimicrobiia bacterium]|nr:cupin domain-containing protein [Acidimicrobiia bacterium]